MSFHVTHSESATLYKRLTASFIHKKLNVLCKLLPILFSGLIFAAETRKSSRARICNIKNVRGFYPRTSMIRVRDPVGINERGMKGTLRGRGERKGKVENWKMRVGRAPTPNTRRHQRIFTKPNDINLLD